MTFTHYFLISKCGVITFQIQTLQVTDLSCYNPTSSVLATKGHVVTERDWIDV